MSGTSSISRRAPAMAVPSTATSKLKTRLPDDARQRAEAHMEGVHADVTQVRRFLACHLHQGHRDGELVHKAIAPRFGGWERPERALRRRQRAERDSLSRSERGFKGARRSAPLLN